jgi:putative hydrolase of the HAD superfamily
MSKVNSKLLLQPDLVVFDLDNTFYDYESAHEMALSALFKDSRMSSEVEAAETYMTARSNVKNRLGSSASSHSRLLYLAECFALLEVEFNTSVLLELEELYWGTFLKEMVVFPASIEFVDELLAKEIKCVLVTDLTATIQYRKIESLELVNKFHYVVTSEEAGGDKSTHLPWKLLDERTQLDSYSTIWYIGDSIHDLNPSMRRSLDVAFLKTNQGPLTATEDYFLFSSFAELATFLE